MISKRASLHWFETIAIATCLGGALFVWQWKYGFNLADEGLLWYLSQRIHFGEMPIRDAFGYDPGRYLWSAAWFKILSADGLFEQRMANAAFGTIGLICAYASMLKARVRVGLRFAVACMLAIALCYPLHKVYEQSLSLIGVTLVACVLSQPSAARWWVALGIATGIAACVGRNSGLYFAIASTAAVATCWRMVDRRAGLRAAGLYALGVFTGYAPMLIWFVLDGRFRHAMIDSVLFTSPWLLPLAVPFPWTIRQDISSVSALQMTAISWLTIAGVVLYASHAFRLYKAITTHQVIRPTFALATAALYLGIPYLHQSFNRADFSHIAQGFLPLFLLACTQLTQQSNWFNRLSASSFLFIAMIAWLPAQPAVRFLLLQRQDTNATRNFPIDGHSFEMERTTAEMLASVGRVATACHVRDGQLVAMPHFPGLLAYLHLRSPYWEMYYLFPRTAMFQQREIRDMESFGTKVAVVDWSSALDGRQDLRFEALDPLLASHIRANFKDIRDGSNATDNISIMVRDCRD